MSERYHLLHIMMNREMKFHWQIIVKKSRKHLPLDAVKVFGDLEAKGSPSSNLSGSGKSDIDQAIAGADVYVTGDIGHHEGIDALARGLNIIDAGTLWGGAIYLSAIWGNYLRAHTFWESRS